MDVVDKCHREELDVPEYFYSTLIDNYEWLHGLDARFGLYCVDFEMLERTPTYTAIYCLPHSEPFRAVTET